MNELAAEEEFAAFRDTPDIFRQAAASYASDARAFLRSEPKSLWHAQRL